MRLAKKNGMFTLRKSRAHLFENICSKTFVRKHLFENICSKIFVRKHLFENICSKDTLFENHLFEKHFVREHVSILFNTL